MCAPSFWTSLWIASVNIRSRSSSVSSKIAYPPFIDRVLRTLMFSSNLFSFSRSFSRPSIRSLVSAFLLLAPYLPLPMPVSELPKFKWAKISSLVTADWSFSFSSPSISVVSSFFLFWFSFLRRCSSGILKPPPKPVRSFFWKMVVSKCYLLAIVLASAATPTCETPFLGSIGPILIP